MRAFEDFVRAELVRNSIDGLTPQQAIFLLSLEGRPQRLVDVVRIQRIVASNATYLVKSLVQTGFIERYPDPEDRRTAIVAPTAKAMEATNLLQAALAPNPTILPQVRSAAAAARLLETACSMDDVAAPPQDAPEPVRRTPPRVVLSPQVRSFGSRNR